MTENNQDQLPQNSENTDLPGASDTNKTDQEPAEKHTDSSGASGTNLTDQDHVQKDFDSIGVFVLRYLHFNGGSKAERIRQDLAVLVKACPDNLNNTVQNVLETCMKLGYIAQNQNSEYITKLSETELKNLIDQVDATQPEQTMAEENVIDDGFDISAGRSIMDLVDPSEEISSFEPSSSKRVIELETEATNKVSIEMAKPLDAEATGRKRHKKSHEYNLRPRKRRFVEQLNNQRKNRRKSGNNGRQAHNTHYGPGRRCGRHRVVNADPKSGRRQVVKRRRAKNGRKAGNNGRQATYSHYGPVCRRCRVALADPESNLRQIVKRRKANNRRKAGRPTYTNRHYDRGHHGRRGGRGGRGRPGRN